MSRRRIRSGVKNCGPAPPLLHEDFFAGRLGLSPECAGQAVFRGEEAATSPGSVAHNGRLHVLPPFPMTDQAPPILKFAERGVRIAPTRRPGAPVTPHPAFANFPRRFDLKKHPQRTRKACAERANFMLQVLITFHCNGLS
jgi:hypothetical protein